MARRFPEYNLKEDDNCVRWQKRHPSWLSKVFDTTVINSRVIGLQASLREIDRAEDITKFKALPTGEDARFCKLVHLVNRNYNTLKEVGNQNDMDNNHMLAVIEKICAEDLKVWSREIKREGGTATLECLMKWMTT